MTSGCRPLQRDGEGAGCEKVAEACGWDCSLHILFIRAGSREWGGSVARLQNLMAHPL